MTEKSQTMRALSLFNRFLRPYWKKVSAIVILSVLVGTMTSIRPLVFAPALESFVESRAEPAADISSVSLNNIGQTLLLFFNVDQSNVMHVGFFVAISFILVSILIAALSAVAEVLLVTSRTSVIRDMMEALHKHLLTLPIAYFYKRKTGDLVSRLNNDVSQTALALNSIARGLMQSSAQALITMIILFRTDAMLCLYIVALGSFHVVITKALGKHVQRKARKLAETHGLVWASIMESFSGIRLIKSFGAEHHESEKMSKAANSLRKNIVRFRLTKYIEVPARFILDAIIVGVALYLAFYSMENGRITPQAAALFFYLSQQLIVPISEFFRNILNFQTLLGNSARVVEIFETKNTVVDGNNVACNLKDRIALNNVSFSYENNNPVLENINCEINKGEMVAVVGPSGAGKSTLIDLILRLYDVDKGSITYDNTDIREFTQQSYRQNFGVVAQESLLFNDTIKNNIIYNSPENKERLEHAIWAANVEEFIGQMPEKLDTQVGDRGVRVSGGQRQRIALARAIYSNPSILALDEATSALDSESERMVQAAINRIMTEMTVIVIAHRLSTITHADKIVVLDKGRIEAVGPHKDILETSATYQRLYNLQFAAPSV